MPRKPTRAKALGIDDAEYARLLESQGGHCALCPNVPKTRRLHGDHDHATGRVRGLLCFRDNKILAGWVTAAWADSAFRYFVRHELRERGRLRYVEHEMGYGSPCWLWMRAISSSGYGVIRYNGQLLYMHRVMYHGLIERGQHVHHRCGIRQCMNPLHLEALAAVDHVRHHERSAATCKRGHEWTLENTYLRPDGSGIRQCRACIRLRSAGLHL